MTPWLGTLRAAYHASGLTFAQLAARAEVSERTVCALLSGRPTQTRTLYRVCVVLQVPTLPIMQNPASRRVPELPR